MSTSLTEALAAEPQQRPGPKCRVCSLPAELRADVERLRLADPLTYPYRRLSRALRRMGHEIGFTSVRDHFLKGHHEG